MIKEYLSTIKRIKGPLAALVLGLATMDGIAYLVHNQKTPSKPSIRQIAPVIEEIREKQEKQKEKNEYNPREYNEDKGEMLFAEKRSEMNISDNQSNISYKTNRFTTDSEDVLLARMIYGEARNCPDIEKIAIAYTAINRAKDGKAWNGRTLKEAILKPWQYSCFNQDDPNREQLKDPEAYDPKAFHDCLKIAKGVLSGKYKDPVRATHYYNPASVKNKPNWARNSKLLEKIKIAPGKSKHIYFREA